MRRLAAPIPKRAIPIKPSMPGSGTAVPPELVLVEPPDVELLEPLVVPPLVVVVPPDVVEVVVLPPEVVLVVEVWPPVVVELVELVVELLVVPAWPQPA